MIKKFKGWMEGCGHPEHSPGVPCRCRLIFPMLTLMVLSALMNLIGPHIR
jgi:hypothetical protein